MIQSQSWHRSRFATGVVVAALLLGATPTASFAATVDDDAGPGDVVVTPTDDSLLIDGKPADIVVMPDFRTSGPVTVIDDRGVVSVDSVTLEGAAGEQRALEPAGRLASEPLAPSAALASCWRNWVAPGSASWYTSVDGCSLIGVTSTAMAGYSWTVDWASLGSACLKGRGYYYLSWPGGGSWYQTYRSVGCGASGSSGGGSVLWGNVASVKKVQMYATSSPIGAAGMFS